MEEGVEDYKCELNGGGSVMFNLSPPFQANFLHEQIQICSPSTLGPWMYATVWEHVMIVPDM